MTGVQAVYAVLEPTSRALWGRGVGSLSSVGTYIPGIARQECRLQAVLEQVLLPRDPYQYDIALTLFCGTYAAPNIDLDFHSDKTFQGLIVIYLYLSR